MRDRQQEWAVPWRYLIGDGLAVLTSRTGCTAVQALGGSGLEAYRRRLLCCDWSELGERQVFVTLTYPKDWRRWCSDASTLGMHRKALVAEWETRWGEEWRGTWKVEFQDRGAPHVHAACALPTAVGDEMWGEIQEWTRALIEAKQAAGGERKGRIGAKVPRFWGWGSNVWCRLAGKKGDKDFRMWGFQVRAAFYTNRAAANAKLEGPGGYLAKLTDARDVFPVVKELGKGRQNRGVPLGFEKVKLWGFEGGFGPRVLLDEGVRPEVAMVLADRMRRANAERRMDVQGDCWGKLGGNVKGVDRWESYSWLQEAEVQWFGSMAERDVERLAGLQVL